VHDGRLSPANATNKKKLQTHPVSAVELARVKIQVIANKVYAQDSIDTQATQLGSLVSVGLPWQLADTYVEHIEKVTADQVQAVANIFLQNNRLTIGILHPLPMSKTNQSKQSATMPLNTSGVR